jgi:Uma2 family endonuclease
MSSPITRKLFTIDDCYKMAEVGILSPDERTELINGEIPVVPPPGPRHGFVVDSLNEAFVKLAQGKAVVRVQGGVVLHRFAAPRPDIVLLRPRGKAYIQKNPDASDIFLIIEVADSSLEQDTTVKLQLYGSWVCRSIGLPICRTAACGFTPILSETSIKPYTSFTTAIP